MDKIEPRRILGDGGLLSERRRHHSTWSGGSLHLLPRYVSVLYFTGLLSMVGEYGASVFMFFGCVEAKAVLKGTLIYPDRVPGPVAYLSLGCFILLDFLHRIVFCFMYTETRIPNISWPLLLAVETACSIWSMKYEHSPTSGYQYAAAPLALTLFNALRLMVRSLLSNQSLGKHFYVRYSPLPHTNVGVLEDAWTRLKSAYHLESEAEGDVRDETQDGNCIYSSKIKLLPGEGLLTTAAQSAEHVRFPLFVHCDCCADDATLIRLNRSRDLEGLLVRSRLYEAWRQGRNAILQNAKVRLSDGFLMAEGEEDRFAQQCGFNKLCETCENFASGIHASHVLQTEYSREMREGFSLSPRTTPVYEHAATPAELASSARDGCHFCTMIWSALSTEQKTQLLEGDRELGNQANSQVQAAGSMHEKRQVEEGYRLQRCIRIAITNTRTLVPHFGTSKRPSRWLKRARGYSRNDLLQEIVGEEAVPGISFRSFVGNTVDLISSNTGSDFSIELISHWMEKDKLSRKASWIPSRLVDVSQLETSGRIRIRSRSQIQNDDVMAEHSQYVALSHCWGMESFLTYNVDTFKDFEAGISIVSLPKTFREALILTSKLGIPYMWIDSLCILQGSPKDWEVEAATMAKVYRSACLTVAAVGSWSASEGLFRDVEALTMGKCLLKPSWNPRRRQYSGIYADSPRPGSVGTLAHEDVRLSKWAHRGWTLQERMLSPRIVYFGNRCIHFEEKCIDDGQTAAEVLSPFDLDERLGKIRRSRKGAEPTTELTREARLRWLTAPGYHTLPPDRRWHGVWWNWVHAFTHRQLTHADDRAMAMLGLAEYMLDLHPSWRGTNHYIAGIWTQELIAGLLWYVGMDHAYQRPSKYRAPSWSWISVDGGVVNESLSMSKQKCEVVVIDVAPGLVIESANPAFSTLPMAKLPQESSYIKLRGRVQQCVWKREDSIWFVPRGLIRSNLNDPGLRSGVVVDRIPQAVPQDVGPHCYPMYHADEPSARPRCIGWFLPDTSDLSDVPANLYCLAFVVEPSNVEWDFWQTQAIKGIAMRPREAADPLPISQDEDLPAFERVGYFELLYQNKGVYFDSSGFFGNLLNRPRRVPPELDPTGVFAGCKSQVFRLY